MLVVEEELRSGEAGEEPRAPVTGRAVVGHVEVAHHEQERDQVSEILLALAATSAAWRREEDRESN